jgi:tetratricopeptide (TPR) repeat protein
MLTLAREAGNLELELQAHAWLAVDLLEEGDRDAVDAQVEAFITGAEQVRQPLYQWHAIVWRAMRALLEGDLERADVLASEALAAGMPAEAVTAPQYYAIQLLAIRREQARIAELERAGREMLDRNPGRPAWRAAVATLLMEMGKLDEARREFEVVAAHEFADIPNDGDWMTAMTLLSEVSVGLDDAERAALLYDRLLPYARANVVIGLAAICYGSTARFLGKLAATMGRRGEGVEHFERALRSNEALRAPVWLAHTQLDYAETLASEPRAASLIEAASRTAAELNLPRVAARVEALRSH